jgi:hypothetical protein
MTTQTETPANERSEPVAQPSGSFARLRNLGPPGQRAADSLAEICSMLKKAGMEQGVTRLRRIDEDADQVDFAVLERRLDRERTIEEFTAKRSRRVHLLHAARNTLPCCPC